MWCAALRIPLPAGRLGPAVPFSGSPLRQSGAGEKQLYFATAMMLMVQPAVRSQKCITQRASWTRSRDDVSGEDQREVRKRLWEVSDLALQPRIVLLREKPQVIS